LGCSSCKTAAGRCVGTDHQRRSPSGRGRRLDKPLRGQPKPSYERDWVGIATATDTATTPRFHKVPTHRPVTCSSHSNLGQTGGWPRHAVTLVAVVLRTPLSHALFLLFFSFLCDRSSPFFPASPLAPLAPPLTTTPRHSTPPSALQR
jgi:hypothetical protein